MPDNNQTIEYKQLLDNGEPFYPMVGKSSYSEWIGYEEVGGSGVQPDNQWIGFVDVGGATDVPPYIVPVANGGTGCTSVTDKFISVEVRYPSSGNYNFTTAGPFYPSGSIPDGYVALLCGQVSTNGFVGSAYATENVYGRTGADAINNIAFWLQFTGTGYLLMRVLCVKA